MEFRENFWSLQFNLANPMDPKQFVLMLILRIGSNRTSVLLNNVIIETQLSFLSQTQRQMNSNPTPPSKYSKVSNHDHSHHRPFQPVPFLPSKIKPGIRHHHSNSTPNELARKTPESHPQPQPYSRPLVPQNPSRQSYSIAHA